MIWFLLIFLIKLIVILYYVEEEKLLENRLRNVWGFFVDVSVIFKWINSFLV